MTALVALLFGLVLLTAAGVVGGLLGWSIGRSSSTQAAEVEQLRREVGTLRALVGSLKDTAWDHRELDPALATIIIDEIRASEKKELE
jgi:hypothetical protein